MPGTDVHRVNSLERASIEQFLDRLGLRVTWVADEYDIPGSYWGDEEAGIIGQTVFLRSDTPVHSMLHEVCHIVCMSPERRRRLNRDAGGDDLEESSVCYLQVLLAEQFPDIGGKALMQDMDAWGYSFRVGATAEWFKHDADDARQWLKVHRLIDAAGLPTFRLRGDT